MKSRKGPRAKKPKYNLVQGELPKKVDTISRALVECARIQEFNMPRGSAGKYPCPYCKEGSIQFSISVSNGHIHAACTSKCIMFMQ